MSLLGYQWLVRAFELPPRPLPVASILGTRLRETWMGDGAVQREYPAHYAPGERLAGHLEFALKHEGVNLAVLAELFRACGPGPVEHAIRTKPTGRYRRLMGFFYELLTGDKLNKSLTVGGNYVAALEPKNYLVAPEPVLNRRWRVRDNLLGDDRYCPIIRRTERLEFALAERLSDELAGLVAEFPATLFGRASDYLYLKETRSTFDIEHEPMPESSRRRRFMALLREAGKIPLAELLDERRLTARQNLIVDPRYAVTGFRDNQNYVGEQRPDFSQRVHYVCPPPEWIRTMMAGLETVARRSAGISPLARAAAVAFGFVYIHPFEDGNGRLHRFLIHDILHRDHFVAGDLILPVSATMVRRMAEYDAALERFSRPLMEDAVEYQLDDDGCLRLLNPDQVESYYRYPDLTAQAEYLAETVAITVREDVAEELRFLCGFDAARGALRDIVDMPDRHLDRLLQLLHQNGGRLSKRKRDQFKEVADEELARIEAAFQAAFGPWQA
jgi:hypothetical protein